MKKIEDRKRTHDNPLGTTSNTMYNDFFPRKREMREVLCDPSKDEKERTPCDEIIPPKINIIRETMQPPLKMMHVLLVDAQHWMLKMFHEC